MDAVVVFSLSRVSDSISASVSPSLSVFLPPPPTYCLVRACLHFNLSLHFITVQPSLHPTQEGFAPGPTGTLLIFTASL